MRTLALATLLALPACGWPQRFALISEIHGQIPAIDGFEGVRAVDGFPSPAFQASFDTAVAQFATTPVGPDGRRSFDILVLSSGGVNGAFGAGILTAWSERGDRPEFALVTGVSVGALTAPFAFAGPQFDDRLETLFRRLRPSDLHHEKGVLGSVLWDESLMDNGPLRKSIEAKIDMELLEAVARRHEAGGRLFVGTTNLDVGDFVIWDLGAIATRRSDAALQLFRRILVASAAIPVLYPPVRFAHGDRDELHADGAVMRPLFMPHNVFDGYLSADRSGISWNDIDATMWVIHNGSLRPRAVEVQRDTLGIAMRTVTMMSYTMVTEHVLGLYILSRVWGADFRFVTLPGGQELSVESFTPDETEKLFLLGQGLIEQGTAWLDAPPGYVINEHLERIEPVAQGMPAPVTGGSVEQRLDRLETLLRDLTQKLRRRPEVVPR